VLWAFRTNGKEKDPVDANIESKFHLADIKKFYPIDSLEVKGDLNIQVKSKGKYDQGKNQFPVTNGMIELRNGSIQTKYYPHPIENIEMIANVKSTRGTMADLALLIESFRFQFEGQPFTIRADLPNFENLKYDITSKGKIDIGKVYKVFSQAEYDVKGFIETDLSLKGSQDIRRAYLIRGHTSHFLKVSIF
jgi:AsmA protein